MNEEELRISNKAIEFARVNKKDIAKRLTNLKQFPSDEIPVSVFMAGSPGAGKTESAKNLIAKFSKDKNILHIDPDNLREEFEDYNGANSSLFQAATSIIADKMQDFALKQKQSYVFDGTLANLERAKENIVRNLSSKRSRKVFIVYVYQDPTQAWKFVVAREEKDGRVIPKQSFIDKYFAARENVNSLKKEYGDKIQVDIIVKNIDGTDFKYRENIDIVDNYVPEAYSISKLDKLIIE
jgi:UDP-N-acetylglucosamine kinase